MSTVQTKILKLPIRISIVILIVGMAFKISHWPGANIIITLAFSSIAVLYAFRFAHKAEKKFLDYDKLFLVTFWSVNGIFTILHLPYKEIFQILTIITFLIFLFMEGLSYFKGSDEKSSDLGKNILTGLLTLGAGLTIIGAIFKIMHWPYGIEMIITGLALGVIWFIIDSMRDKS